MMTDTDEARRRRTEQARKAALARSPESRREAARGGAEGGCRQDPRAAPGERSEGVRQANPGAAQRGVTQSRGREGAGRAPRGRPKGDGGPEPGGAAGSLTQGPDDEEPGGAQGGRPQGRRDPQAQPRGREGRGAGLMHYEIEQAGLGREHGPDVGTHAEPERWHTVAVFNADAVPMPLGFDTLQQALDYVRRTPGTLRVVGVDDRGERVPM